MKIKSRSYYSKLPWEIRKRILRLLFDGAEYEDVRCDPDVAKACDARGFHLSDRSLTALRRSEEYRKYEAALMETIRQTECYKWASEALKNTAGLYDIANVAQLRLLEQLRMLAEQADGDAAELLKLTSAITKIKDSAENEKIAELKRKLQEKEKRIAELREEHAADIAAQKEKYESEIKEIADAGKSPVDPVQIADELKRTLGVTA